MFRLDRRIRSASSKIKKLENSAEMALAKAQQTATRTLSLRSRSRSRPATAERENGQKVVDENGSDVAEDGPSNTLIGLLSPRNWGKAGNTDRMAAAATFELCKEGDEEMDLDNLGTADLEKVGNVAIITKWRQNFH
jgi:hypothetical protein